MALKSVDDVDWNGFDDELSSTEIAYLAKNFRNLPRNNNKRARGKTMLNLETLRGMNRLKLIILRNKKKKLVKPLVTL